MFIHNVSYLKYCAISTQNHLIWLIACICELLRRPLNHRLPKKHSFRGLA